MGPREEEEEFWELRGDKPTSRYISGVLYPKQTKLDADTQLTDTVQGENEDEEEEPINQDTSPFAIATGTQPSSLGITCCVPIDTKLIDVEVNFAKYDKQERKMSPKKNKKTKTDKAEEKIDESSPEESMEIGWKRRGINVPFTINTEILSGDKDIQDEHAKIIYKIKKKPDNIYLTIYLVNTRTSIIGIDHYTTSDECIFQPEIKLMKSEVSEANSIFYTMKHHKEFSIEKEFEEQQFDLLFRDKNYFAVGHNCSVDWEKDKINAQSVNWVKTTFVPQYNVDTIEPRKAESNTLSKSLQLATLKSVKDFSEYKKLLSPIVLEYEKWIDELENQTESIPKDFVDNDVTSYQIKNCREAKSRIQEGIELISTDKIAGEAFRFANNAMHDQMIYSRWAKENIKKGGKEMADSPPFTEYEQNRPPTWYVFQIAFILLNLKSFVEPKSNDREIVDLLWFPTGGGKTEAYLGIIAFLLAMRRLEIDPQRTNDGVHVIMRYTYRLLTIQQFHRAAALMCSCEYIRQNNPTKWGTEPFRVGLFVGNDTTPNSLKTAIKNKDLDVDKENPVQIINCPRCGKELNGKYDYKVVSSPRRMAIKCNNVNCFFGNPNNHESYLPVVFIDDDIISTLPSLLIGTVDKFARLAWDSKFAALFGKVREVCQKHGWKPATAKPGNNPNDVCKHASDPSKNEKVINIDYLTPPELIIQDELHLITGPLGTLTGLYETIVEDLCLSKEGIKPKIIASTATIKNSENQIKWLFARESSKIFPPQAFDFGETYFSKVIHSSEKMGRIHLGICSTSAGGFTGDARIASVVLRKIRYILENKDNEFNYTSDEIDPYYTLVSYYNTIKNVGSALRYYEDTVPPYMGTISKNHEKNGSLNKHSLQLAELTGRLDASDIPEIFKELEIGLSKEMCTCDESKRIQLTETTTVCNTCKKQFKRPLDALLCTNMLSVGVDIQRLSLMIINNQPKHTSEYIQASGRIGRSENAPGLVITNYRYMAARDLSIFENFDQFHSMYHKEVEPGTLTPFAGRARETALFGVLVALIRNHSSRANGCHSVATDPSRFLQTNTHVIDLYDKIKKRLEARVDLVDPNEKDDTIRDFDKCRDDWLKYATKYGDQIKYKRNYYEFASRPPDNIRFLLKTIGDTDPPTYEGKQIPVSMRQTDGNVKTYYVLPSEAENEET